MAVLAAYMFNKDVALEDFLENEVFANAIKKTIAPNEEEVKGYNLYIQDYKKLLEAEKKAVEVLK
jgi:sugar (pentulose or hexulose) kinase